MTWSERWNHESQEFKAIHELGGECPVAVYECFEFMGNPKRKHDRMMDGKMMKKENHHFVILIREPLWLRLRCSVLPCFLAELGFLS